MDRESSTRSATAARPDHSSSSRSRHQSSALGSATGVGAILLALIATGCSSGGGGRTFQPPGGGMTADEACALRAAATCSRLDNCRTNGVALRYGDTATCVSRNKIACLAGLAAPGTAQSATTTAACAAGMTAATCAQFSTRRVAACQPIAGLVADGAPCAFHSQCASTFCSVVPGGACGVCGSPPRIGESCANHTCAPGQVCNQDAVCDALGQQDAHCDLPYACDDGLECVGSSVESKGTCQAPVTTLGSICDRHIGPLCEYDLGLTCLSPPDTSAGTCFQYRYAQSGGRCSFDADTMSNTLCTHGASCINRVCVAPAADGGRCDRESGPPCLSPARCITGGTGTAGTCTLVDFGSCTPR